MCCCSQNTQLPVFNSKVELGKFWLLPATWRMWRYKLLYPAFPSCTLSLPFIKRPSNDAVCIHRLHVLSCNSALHLPQFTYASCSLTNWSFPRTLMASFFPQCAAWGPAPFLFVTKPQFHLCKLQSVTISAASFYLLTCACSALYWGSSCSHFPQWSSTHLQLPVSLCVSQGSLREQNWKTKYMNSRIY